MDELVPTKGIGFQLLSFDFKILLTVYYAKSYFLPSGNGKHSSS
jgi:hypothetical protein